MKITNVQRVSYPASRFIGYKYTDDDRVNGDFGQLWGKWFQNGWFATLEKLGGLAEAGDSYIGLMRCADPFEYWIGMFFPAGTDVPDQFAYIDMPSAEYGVCWLYGNDKSGELFGMDAHNACLAKLKENGLSPKNCGWAMELYNCPRFTTPDEAGNVVLDYLIEVE